MIFLAIWTTGDVLQYFLNSKEMPVVVPDTPTDVFDLYDNLKRYIKTTDPAICTLYSETGQTTPDSSAIKCLDRLPWHKFRVTKAEAVSCLQLQDKLMQYDLVKCGEMVDQIGAELESHTFKPIEHGLSEGVAIEEGNSLSVTLPKMYRESNLVQGGGTGLRWAVYTGDSNGIAFFIYDMWGELYRAITSNNGQIILMSISQAALITMGIHIMQEPLPGNAVAIIGEATRHAWSSFSVSRADLFSHLPPVTGQWIWQSVSHVESYVLFAANNPKAVGVIAAVLTTWYYHDEIKNNLNSGIAGIGLLVVATAAIAYDQIRSTKRRKLL